MRPTALPLLLAASALAQSPTSTSPPSGGESGAKPEITIFGLGPAGTEATFTGQFKESDKGANTFDVNCTGTAGYCGDGGFTIITYPDDQYSLYHDDNGTQIINDICHVAGTSATCEVEILNENLDVLSTTSTTRNGSVVISLPPKTVTTGTGDITGTRTTTDYITELLASTVTVSSTTGHVTTYAAHVVVVVFNTTNSSSSLTSYSALPSTTTLSSGNSTTPYASIAPTGSSAVASFTGAASSVKMVAVTGGHVRMIGPTVGAAMMGVALVAFLL